MGLMLSKKVFLVNVVFFLMFTAAAMAPFLVR